MHATPEDTRSDLPLVVIGSSAGGFNALKGLIEAIGTSIESTVLVIQHLDPSRTSRLAELLSRHAHQPVEEATNGVRIGDSKIYVAPPGCFMAVENGHIHLSERPDEIKVGSPIDDLFRSAAAFAGANTIGVILSGTGNDGSQGARAIKAAGGVVLVQSPEEADFDGMPNAVIEEVNGDSVDDVEALGGILKRLLTSGRLTETSDDVEIDAEIIDTVIRLLRDNAGYDFTGYKPWTLIRRVRRRIGIVSLKHTEEYLDLLRADPEECRMLSLDLLIGVTHFFRDPEAWASLRREAIEPALASMKSGEVFRAWVAGCATGEEAYTLAILLLESIEASGKDIDARVFATDVNRDAVEAARAARYPLAAVSEVSSEIIEKYFTVDEKEVVVHKSVRESVVFAVQNALHDPPFSALDLVCCRNLLIYLNAEAQSRLVETFCFALVPGAHLLLGTSENLDRNRKYFAPVDKANRIYVRTDRELSARSVPALGSSMDDRRISKIRHSARNEDAGIQAMLARFVPPAAIVDSSYRLIAAHGELADVMDLDRKSLALNFVDMLAHSLRPQVQLMLRSASDSGDAQESLIRISEAKTDYRVLVEPLGKLPESDRLIIYFERKVDRVAEALDPGSAAARAEGPEDDVVLLRRDLTAMIESSEKSQEDLQTANEEIMSVNEELQSSNEELESSREELTSLNEELTSINDELEKKVTELEAINDDLTNLIRSTDIATIFLDTELCIRRFSQPTTDIISIRESDVGRPLADLSLQVSDPELIGEAAQVLRSLSSREAEVRGKSRSYIRRITPYKTSSEKIDGVVITYADVTRLSAAMQDLSRQAARQRSITKLGEQALGSEDWSALLERTAELLKEGLSADFIEIQQLNNNQKRLVLVAGAGWPQATVGTARTRNDGKNQASFILHHRGPLIVKDFDDETRVERSELLESVGARGGISVAVGPPTNPWGIISAWWSKPYEPAADAINFLASMANLLWLALSQSENKRLRDEERQELKSLIDGLPIMIGLVDEELRFELCNEAFEATGYTANEAVGEEVEQVLGRPAAKLAMKLASSVDGNEAGREIRIRLPAGNERTFLLYGVPRRRKGDRHRGLFLAALDIDDRKKSEERNRIISAELDHRVKNILALVSTIARMTARNSTGLEHFTDAFSERIESLARIHASLSQRNWEGVGLKQLVEIALEAYTEGSYSIDGPELTLSPASTETLSMAFHELTTNAMKYGAFSVPGGQLFVSWRRVREGVLVTWRETGVGKIAKPEKLGFGSKMLDIAINRQLSGELEVEFGEDGLECQMLVPKESIREQT